MGSRGCTEKRRESHVHAAVGARDQHAAVASERSEVERWKRSEVERWKRSEVERWKMRVWGASST